MNNNFKVDFIGIGSKSSASGWIFNCLGEHPAVCLSSQKETYFFRDDEKYSKGLDYYKEYFKHCEQNSIKGEFSPGYFTNLKTAKRISENFPDAKLILCVRNPVEKLYSQFHKKSNVKSINEKTFEEYIDNQEFLDEGFYKKHLLEYYKFFKKDQVLILLYEDIQKDPKEFIKKVYNFLEIDNSFIPSGVDKYYNSPRGRGGLKMLVAKFLSKLKRKIFLKFKIGRHINDYIERKGIRQRLETYLCKVDGDLKERPPIKAEIRDKLNNIFKQDIADFEKLADLNLSEWRNEKESI